MKRELLVGCGSSREKRIVVGGDSDWQNLTTLDITSSTNPDVVWNLNEFPYPFEDDFFEEIHAYEVLEHLGSQGDFKSFFDSFAEFWRILKNDGLLIGTVPWWQGRFALADPGHTRLITPDTLAFLSQRFYAENEGTVITDYRWYYSGDFEPVYHEVTKDQDGVDAGFNFALKANK